MLEEFKALFHPEIAEVYAQQFHVYEEKIRELDEKLEYSFELLDEALKRIDVLEGRLKKRAAPPKKRTIWEKFTNGLKR